LTNDNVSTEEQGWGKILLAEMERMDRMARTENSKGCDDGDAEMIQYNDPVNGEAGGASAARKETELSHRP
jgi:hypothetical protein